MSQVDDSLTIRRNVSDVSLIKLLDHVFSFSIEFSAYFRQELSLAFLRGKLKPVSYLITTPLPFHYIPC